MAICTRLAIRGTSIHVKTKDNYRDHRFVLDVEVQNAAALAHVLLELNRLIHLVTGSNVVKPTAIG